MIYIIDNFYRFNARRGAPARRIYKQALETPREPCYPLRLCVSVSFISAPIPPDTPFS